MSTHFSTNRKLQLALLRNRHNLCIACYTLHYEKQLRDDARLFLHTVASSVKEMSYYLSLSCEIRNACFSLPNSVNNSETSCIRKTEGKKGLTWKHWGTPRVRIRCRLPWRWNDSRWTQKGPCELRCTGEFPIRETSLPLQAETIQIILKCARCKAFRKDKDEIIFSIKWKTAGATNPTGEASCDFSPLL